MTIIVVGCGCTCEKGEALCAFKKFKRLVKNESDHKLKTLCTDRGGEFLYQNFSNFCEEEGIKCQLTTPYTLQQNGVVDRRYCTIMNTPRSLRKSMQVPTIFLGEAIQHAVYLLKHLPTNALDTRTCMIRQDTSLRL